jgi:UDPglucose 6-dehydrogenase
LLSAVTAVNDEQRSLLVEQMRVALGDLRGRRIGLLGLAFKPDTDDVRCSPALAVGHALAEAGAVVVAHDPVALPAARKQTDAGIAFVADCYEAANDADAVVIATDWKEYGGLDFRMLRKLMAGDFIFDARNMFDGERVAAAGLVRVGFGTPPLRRSDACAS